MWINIFKILLLLFLQKVVDVYMIFSFSKNKIFCLKNREEIPLEKH
jgi:hypothetical protein